MVGANFSDNDDKVVCTSATKVRLTFVSCGFQNSASQVHPSLKHVSEQSQCGKASSVVEIWTSTLRKVRGNLRGRCGHGFAYADVLTFKSRFCVVWH